MSNLTLEGAKNYPIKWICNFRGQKAIGICSYSQKIAMFAHDERVPLLIQDLIIGSDKTQEEYGCEEEDRCCNFECEYCKISPEQYLQITKGKSTKKAIADLELGLKSLNEEIENEGFVPFEKYEVIDKK
ncbi:hypothetical protein [Methanobrevibacter sp. DSM 116169]|uniref:hypothetical protein n=1 Tax=Methanobrevibacter sp. DSM 116169 TaxID=3242727 RepID=UPI0038FC4B0A